MAMRQASCIVFKTTLFVAPPIADTSGISFQSAYGGK